MDPEFKKEFTVCHTSLENRESTGKATACCRNYVFLFLKIKILPIFAPKIKRYINMRNLNEYSEL